MHQLISRKISIYLFLFFLLVSINNNSIINFKIPKINRIEITGLNFDESKEIKKIIEKLNLKNIFLINQKKIQQDIIKVNTIEELSIFKKYPSTLKVDIRKTEFLAITKKNGFDYYIGSNGKLIKKDKSFLKLPYVFGNLNIEEFLKLKNYVDMSNLKFDEIINLYFYKSKRWDIETSEGYLIKLPKDNVKKNLDLFVRLSNDGKFKDNSIIDFRQKDQIILDAR
tara:strand:+ start:41 stop:715 length:675 start_codon:yes stop_codon:yes gene_type:complete